MSDKKNVPTNEDGSVDFGKVEAAPKGDKNLTFKEEITESVSDDIKNDPSIKKQNGK